MKSEFTPDTYYFTTDDGLAHFELSRIRTERGDIICEIEVRWHGVEDPGLLHHGKLNLVSERSVTTLGNLLRQRIDGETVDWVGWLTGITYAAKNRYRNGEPPIRLSEVDTAAQTKWLLRPLLEHGGPTVLAAPGGSAKSMLALGVAATVATGRSFIGINTKQAGPVLYLDWEADKYAHRNRLDALCHAIGETTPDNVYYRREYAPLHESTEELTRQVKDLEAVMVVVDSKGASLSGAPEEADGTLRFFRALRTLGVPALVVDHVTNASAAGKGPSRPFGSVYTQNMARNVWMARRTDQAEGQTTVVWQHTKSNNGPTGRKLAWQMDFALDGEGTDNERYQSIRIKPVSPVTVTSIDATKSLTDRLAEIMHREQRELMVAELVDLTGASADGVRARLNEGARSGLFTNINAGKKPSYWLLAAQDLQRRMK